MHAFKWLTPARLVFPLACLATVAMLFISEGSYWQSALTLDQLASMGKARGQLMDLQRGMLDAETGQRGYLLTGRREYLRPYEQALADIAQAFLALDLYYGAQPGARTLLDQLHGLSATRLSELARTIELRESGRVQASQDMALTDIGRQEMEAIRGLGDQLLAQEAAKVEAGRGDVYHTLLLSRVGLVALSALSLLALFMYLRQSAVHKKREQGLQRNVQRERDRLEIEVLQRTAQLTELTQHLQSAREDERGRLARNLHDELGALLTSAKLDAARIKSRLAGQTPEALELLAHLVGTLNSGIALGRRIIEDLRPSALSQLGLVAALEILAREFAAHSGVRVVCALEPVALKPQAELTVYRLVQEAITNIAKYASASQVWISLGPRGAQVEVSVRDDGQGFDPRVPARSAYGLVGMRFRVEAEGGTLSLLSAPGQGATIRASLPASTSQVVEPPATLA